MAFEVYHKIDQVIFKWELLVTDNAGSISKHMLLLKVECTWINVGRVDRVQALHVSGEAIIRIGHGEVFFKEN